MNLGDDPVIWIGAAIITFLLGAGGTELIRGFFGRKKVSSDVLLDRVNKVMDIDKDLDKRLKDLEKNYLEALETINGLRHDVLTWVEKYGKLELKYAALELRLEQYEKGARDESGRGQADNEES